ncbi:hypothetical protein BGZ59_001622 [Podila verticillata]|nr:hypothetical protein BGZ59_001622 [Podila verticillata]
MTTSARAPVNVDVKHGPRSQVSVAKIETYDTKGTTNRNIALDVNMELMGLEAKSQVRKANKELFECIKDSDSGP